MITEPYTYIFIAPDGTRYRGYNVRRFCIEHDLDHTCMLRVKSGERVHHKGWRFDEAALLKEGGDE